MRLKNKTKICVRYKKVIKAQQWLPRKVRVRIRVRFGTIVRKQQPTVYLRLIVTTATALAWNPALYSAYCSDNQLVNERPRPKYFASNTHLSLITVWSSRIWWVTRSLIKFGPNSSSVGWREFLIMSGSLPNSISTCYSSTFNFIFCLHRVIMFIV